MRMLSTGFYLLLSIAGLSVLTLGSLIGVQYFRGRIQPSDLREVLLIIGGNHRVVVPSGQYDRFQQFSRDEQKARADLEENRGMPQTREPVVLRTQETIQALHDNLAVVNRQLNDEKTRVEAIRGEVEAQKRQVADLRRALDDERAKNATVDKDAATAKLRKTLSEMDAGDVATFLTAVIRDPSQGGPSEAARIIREHLKADYSAEVLAEMPPLDRQKVLPLLENRFAGVPPDAVVKIFADQKTSPGEMLVYMLQMNPQQAFGVYMRLPSETQEQLGQRVLKLQ